METLVFLHGWGGSKESLSLLSKEFENEYETLLLEFPGHGSTPPPESGWNMQDFSMWVGDQLASKNVTDYILIGHSFGGKTILEAVSSGTLTPEKIVLIDSSGMKPTNSLKKTIFKSASTFVKPIFNFPGGKVLRKILYKSVVGETDYVKAAGTMKESFQEIVDQHYDDKLQNIKLPTIIIWGKQDSETPLMMAKKLNAGIAGSKLFVIDGTHGLPLKNPKAVSEIIKNNI